MADSFWEYEIGLDGLAVWQGRVWNFLDLEVEQSRLWVEEKYRLLELRAGETNGRPNIVYDKTLNLPGVKPDFIDTTYHFLNPIRSQEGKYPDEIGPDDWKNF